MQLKNLSTAILMCLLIISCDFKQDPYFKHEVKLEKIGKGCEGKSDQFSMNSNTNGERYSFQECLDVNSDSKNVIIERNKDTVTIRFNRTGAGQQLYQLTVDINTKPQYNWLVVGDNTIAIIPEGN